LSQTAQSVDGVELSSASVDLARHTYSAPNLQFHQADVYDFLTTSSKLYDLITSFETIEHLIDGSRFLSLLWSHLSPGGTLILSTPNRYFSQLIAGEVFNPYHLYEYTLSELNHLFQSVTAKLPQIYLQRPVNRLLLWPSLVYQFLLSPQSSIVPNSPSLLGLDLIVLATKSGGIINL
jgi:SAM-dependent methyltransferase